jgi:transcription elongation factor SPT5
MQGVSAHGDVITVNPLEMEHVVPKKFDKIKVINGPFRNSTGKLIGIDGAEGIVKMDVTLDVQILDMSNLAHMYS